MHERAQLAFLQAKNFFLEGFDDLSRLKEEKKRGHEEFKKIQKGAMKPAESIHHIRYLAHLNAMEKVKTEDVLRRAKEADGKKEALLKISKEKKAVEKLKERKQKDFFEELSRFEEKQIDESAINRFNGKNGKFK